MSSKDKKKSSSLRKIFPKIFVPQKQKNQTEAIDENEVTGSVERYDNEYWNGARYAIDNAYEDPVSFKDYVDDLPNVDEKYKSDIIDASCSTLVPESSLSEVECKPSPQVPTNSRNTISTEIIQKESTTKECDLIVTEAQLPHSVGAEIRSYSTSFTISPKKEAEVRLTKQLIAKSLSVELALKEDSSKDKIPIYGSINQSTKNKQPKVPKNEVPDLHERSVSPYFDKNIAKAPKITQKPNVDSKELEYWKKLKALKLSEENYLMNQALKTQDSSKSFKPIFSDTKSGEGGYESLNTPTTSISSNHLSKSDHSPSYAAVNRFVRHGFGRNTIDGSLSRYKQQYNNEDIVLRHPEKRNIAFGNSSQNVPLNETKKYGKINTIYGRLQASGVPKSRISDPSGTSSSLTSASAAKMLMSRRIDSSLRSSSTLGTYSGSESGSEAGEVQRILANAKRDENWRQDANRNDEAVSDGETGGGGRNRGRQSRRDDPRRHTLGSNHMAYPPGRMNQQQMRVGDMEPGWRHRAPGHCNMAPLYASVQKRQPYIPNLKNHKPPIPRGYQPHHNAMMFDDDPGIMSEVETASTGFRRGGKQRSSLPVVRTPSKTLERPLGLVFLQYRSETKRALLPNEITSIDTVKALFVRSFPKQLTMQYMDSPLVKIYIHDSNKDMFYELEDVRSHLRDIRDRSVLRLFESADIGGAFPGVLGVGGIAMPAGSAGYSGPPSWDQDQSYFSEPEVDGSEYHHQHVHKSKVSPKAAPFYMTAPGSASTLPRGGGALRAYSPAGAAAPIPAERIKTLPPASHTDGYMSSPERMRPPYDDSTYYSPYMRHGPISTVIDEETSDAVMMDSQYSVYANKPGRQMRGPPFDSAVGPPRPNTSEELNRLRVEQMERQLANLTGLVHKALQAPPQPREREYLQAAATAFAPRSTSSDGVEMYQQQRAPKLGKDKYQKSVSFEKSVSFCDDPPDHKPHSPQHSADSKPAKPAIKSSTLPRMSSQDRDRLKPAPPPKPVGLMTPTPAARVVPQMDLYNQLRSLLKQCRDLKVDMKTLRRLTSTHMQSIRQEMTHTFTKLVAMANGVKLTERDIDIVSREEEAYKEDMQTLEKDLYELENTVEMLRGRAANREMRVNMCDVEQIAMILSKSSKTVAEWKLRFPVLQESMKRNLNNEMEKVVRREKLLDEEPERLELALRRCKKLTGTLVTLKRLACVQEQRIPCEGRVTPPGAQCGGHSSDELNSESSGSLAQPSLNYAKDMCAAGPRATTDVQPRPENALDALLDELQTFAKPPAGDASLRRLHSYPSGGSDTDPSPPVRPRNQLSSKPPVPERHPELLAMAAKRAPPPPPPRTTSRSPLASPTSPKKCESSSNESGDSQDGNPKRQELLERRHQELLKKQKSLQEQYNRLQMIQRSNNACPPDLKKTGSESNIITKMNLNLATTNSGSLTQLVDRPNAAGGDAHMELNNIPKKVETAKVYETEIL